MPYTDHDDDPAGFGSGDDQRQDKGKHLATDKTDTNEQQCDFDEPGIAPSLNESLSAPTATDTDNNSIEPDRWTDDEGYAESTSTRYLSSIASDIRRGVEENGRLYAAYGMHKQWLPIDDEEVFLLCWWYLHVLSDKSLTPCTAGPQ